VNGKELDDEEIILRTACPALETTIHQPNTMVGFAIILDDNIGCSKMLRETCMAHAVPECLGPWLLGAKAVPFFIIVPTVMQVACTVLGACPIVSPYELDGMSEAWVSAWVARPETGQAPCRCSVIHHSPLQASIGTARSQDRSLIPPLQ
jgi:hypothetical protein